MYAIIKSSADTHQPELNRINAKKVRSSRPQTSPLSLYLTTHAYVQSSMLSYIQPPTNVGIMITYPAQY